jgi:hypothetical protein
MSVALKGHFELDTTKSDDLAKHCIEVSFVHFSTVIANTLVKSGRIRLHVRVAFIDELEEFSTKKIQSNSQNTISDFRAYYSAMPSTLI